MSKVCIFLGTGFEEIEALTVVDVLRRQQIEITMVSIMKDKVVMGAHQIKVTADAMLEEIDFSKVDVIILPGGGGGTKQLAACEPLLEQVDAFAKAGKTICAICAAPSILGQRGILKGKKATAFPGFEGQLEGAEVICQPVVKDGNIITGRGMGCSLPFALAVLEHLAGKEAAEKMAEKIIY